MLARKQISMRYLELQKGYNTMLPVDQARDLLNEQLISSEIAERKATYHRK